MIGRSDYQQRLTNKVLNLARKSGCSPNTGHSERRSHVFVPGGGGHLQQVYFGQRVQGRIVRDQTAVEEAATRTEEGRSGSRRSGGAPHQLLCRRRHGVKLGRVRPHTVLNGRLIVPENVQIGRKAIREETHHHHPARRS